MLILLSGFGIKLKFILLALCQCKTHTWKSSGSWVMSQNNLSLSDYKILQSAIFQEKSDASTWFLACI